MFRIRDGIRAAKTEEGSVLMDIRENQILSTNLVGTKILDLLREGREESEIANEVSRTYKVSIETAAADVREFVQCLEARGVVVASPHGQSPGR
jgi:Coenzyme PQQ synthesis protein D (PqqD)